MITMTTEIIVYGLIFIVGACIGSFLNVCIYRIPRNQSIVRPGSQCPFCKTKIQWYDNIPIFSWLILGGRCRHCKKAISYKYPLIEILTAILFSISWHFLDPKLAIIGMVFVSLLIIATFIDFDHLIIPDRITMGGFILGCVISIIVPELHGLTQHEPYVIKSFFSLITALKGAFLGSGLLIWIAFLSEVILKQETMGLADIKLMGCIGSFCGWQGALFSIGAGAVLAVVILIPFLLIKKWLYKEETLSHKVIPFGPWLSLGAILYFIVLRKPVDTYFNSFINLF